ncbi:Leucine rich repeat/Leucine Rich repeat [Novymonas esmeraldas]|uniref:Leucine rich repeat/Leucine Rich repeat n=1 Tax=Novymonas esmeraldas TaxID=1808958 RepID=A0AAW0EUM1_9TRYP
MLNATLRSKRPAAAASHPPPAAAESEFHQTRMQEQLRTHAMKEFGATEQQVAPSYFATSLQELCAQRLADGFAASVEVDALREEQPELYAMVLARLPTHPDRMLPLRITVPRIVEEAYWRRCCESRWPLGQLSRMAAGERLREKEYGWKRLFLEQVLSDFLMSLGSGSAAGSLLPPGAMAPVTGAALSAPPHRSQSMASTAVTCTPHDADASRFDLSTDDEAIAALRELCAICRDYVHTIDLPCQLVHFRFYEHLFAHVPGILSFRLTFGVANRGVRVGVADMIGFRDEDAQLFHQLLRHYTAIESLRLPLNRLADRHVQMIAAGLVSSTTLRVLDLSQNSLTDTAVVEAVSLLLCRPDFPLEELYLYDNQLADAAAAALADALQYNKTLRIVHLQQNCIGDAAGGVPLARALAIHPTLTDVNLGSNRLGARTVAALSEVLPQLTQLRVLRLSGNTELAGATVCAPGAGAAPSSPGGGAATATVAATASINSLPSVSSMSFSPTSAAHRSAAGAAEALEGEDEEEHQGEGEEGEQEEEEDAVDGNDASLTPASVAAAGEAYRATATARPSMATVAGDDASLLPRASPRHPKKAKDTSPVMHAAAAPPPPLSQTSGGVLLAAAVRANTSLVELDVRFCGLTAAEEQTMMRAVQERVYQAKMDAAAALHDSEQRRAQQRRAEERVARMTGRTF